MLHTFVFSKTNRPLYKNLGNFIFVGRDVIYQYLYGHICFCKCKLFPFFPAFCDCDVLFVRVCNKCDNGSRRVFVRPVKIKMVD